MLAAFHSPEYSSVVNINDERDYDMHGFCPFGAFFWQFLNGEEGKGALYRRVQGLTECRTEVLGRGHGAEVRKTVFYPNM